MIEEKTIRYGIVSIATDEFAMLEKYDDSKIGELKIYLNFNGLAEEIIQVKCLFYQEDNPFMVIAVSTSFQIHPEEWTLIYNSDTNKIHLPLGIALHMSSLSVGTTRGILHAKTENHSVNSVIIPPVNLNDIIKENIVIDSLPAST
jgi:hypothetical protein